jgi:hypothetical protein
MLWTENMFLVAKREHTRIFMERKLSCTLIDVSDSKAKQYKKYNGKKVVMHRNEIIIYGKYKNCCAKRIHVYGSKEAVKDI